MTAITLRDARLQSPRLEESVAVHWRKHCPQMTADYKAQGLFDERVRAAADALRSAMRDLMRGEMAEANAYEMCREEYAFFPAETRGKKTRGLP